MTNQFTLVANTGGTQTGAPGCVYKGWEVSMEYSTCKPHSMIYDNPAWEVHAWGFVQNVKLGRLGFWSASAETLGEVVEYMSPLIQEAIDTPDDVLLADGKPALRAKDEWEEIGDGIGGSKDKPSFYDGTIRISRAWIPKDEREENE